MKSILRCLFSIIILFIFVINQAIAQQPAEQTQSAATTEIKDGIRIAISTSGPVKFSSNWLDNPHRLIVKFQSKNVVSNIDKEITVNQGIIKKITSRYSGRGKNRSLKSLAFELTQETPYRILQEGNTILLDIYSPLKETSAFPMGGKEIFAAAETNDIVIKKLEAMDAALMEVKESREALEVPKTETVKKVEEGIAEAKMETALPESKALPVAELPKTRKSMMGMVVWLIRSALILFLGFLVWYKYRPNIKQKLKKLISSFESLKNRFVKKSMAEKTKLPEKKTTLPAEKEKPCIAGESQERRTSPRLSLTKDYNKTIIVRIESQNSPRTIKSFAANISSGGLCLETKEEFKKKEPLNLTLFFYGAQIPMMKIQTKIIWKKLEGAIKYYGLAFDSIEKKDKLELNRFIESSLSEATT